MRSSLVFVAFLLGCQLADDPEPPRCAEGMHPELNRCVVDETAKLRVVIAQGCAVTPEALTVKASERFQVENKDTVAHDIIGTSDGQKWMSVPPNTLSDFLQIQKAGTWGYSVSGCAKGGSIVVP